jgi:hypothetical protein
LNDKTPTDSITKSNEQSKATMLQSKNFFRASSIGQIYNEGPQSSLEADGSYKDNNLLQSHKDKSNMPSTQLFAILPERLNEDL